MHVCACVCECVGGACVCNESACNKPLLNLCSEPIPFIIKKKLSGDQVPPKTTDIIAIKSLAIQYPCGESII